MRSLLEAGAIVNVRDNQQGTPLSLAASSGSARVLELLILAGADVHAENGAGWQAIHHASRHQNEVEPVKVLLRAGALVNCTNRIGQSPLSGAAIANRHKIGAYLLDHGADMHIHNIYGDTSLFETIVHSNHEFLQMLLERGAATHARVNNSGSTILHAAALEADLKTLNILKAARLSGGWWCSARDNRGQTALEKWRSRVAGPDGFEEALTELIADLEARSVG